MVERRDRRFVILLILSALLLLGAPLRGASPEPRLSPTDSLTVNPLLSNWSVRASAGLNRFTPIRGIGTGRLSAGYDWVLGKAFSPYGGARLGLQGGEWSMWGTAPSAYGLWEPAERNGRTFYKEDMHFAYLHGDVYLNLFQTLFGTSSQRRLEFAPYMHFGVIDSYKGDKHIELEFASGFGGTLDWSISPRLSATMDVRFSVFTAAFSPDRWSPNPLGLSILGGLTYYPGETGWHNYRRGGALHNDFGANWFITAKGGVNTIGTMKHFKGASAPAVDFTLGRWFSPQFALRFGWQGYEFAGRGLVPRDAVQTRPDGSLYVERFGFSYIHGDVLWNVLPHSSGVLNRWHFGPYVHMGFFSTWGLDKGTHMNNHYAAGPGLQLDYQLLRRLRLEMDLRGFLLQSGTAGDEDTKGGYVMAGSGLVGVSVMLGRPDWRVWKPKPRPPRPPRKPLGPAPEYLLGSFWDNWSAQLSVGMMGASLASDVAISKWVIPSVGIRTGLMGLTLSKGSWTTGIVYFHQDLLLSAADTFSGYDPQRRWRLSPYVHFGVLSEYGPATVPYSGRGVEYSAGLGLSYRYKPVPRLVLVSDLRTMFLTSSAAAQPKEGNAGVVPALTFGVEYLLSREGWRGLSEASRTEGKDYRLARGWDNWFLTGTLGVNGFAGYGEMEDSRTGLAADLSLGRWLSPYFGLRGGWQGLRLGRMADEGRAGAYMYEENGRFRERLGFAYVHGDFLWDLSSTFGEQKDRHGRLLSFAAYAHMGGFLEYGVSHSSRALFERELVAGAGFLTDLRIDETVSLTLDLRTSILRGEAMGETPSPPGGLLPSALVGLTTYLGNQGFEGVTGSGSRPRIREKARWAVSANLFDVALFGTAGASVQYAWSRHWSAEAAARYNPFSFSRTMYDRRQSYALAARWWPWHAYTGLYVRGSAQVETGSRKGLPLFEDWAGESYGAGCSVGYAFMLSRHLNLDLGAGLWAGRQRPLTVDGHHGKAAWFAAPDAISLSASWIF